MCTCVSVHVCGWVRTWLYTSMEIREYSSGVQFSFPTIWVPGIELTQIIISVAGASTPWAVWPVIPPNPTSLFLLFYALFIFCLQNGEAPVAVPRVNTLALDLRLTLHCITVDISPFCGGFTQTQFHGRSANHFDLQCKVTYLFFKGIIKL